MIKRFKKSVYIVCLVVVFCILQSLTGFCVENYDNKVAIEQDLLKEKLRNDEIETVKDAVDKALSKSQISKAYDLSSEKILNDALKGNPMKSLDRLPKILLALLGKEIKTNLALILQLFAVMLIGAVIRSLQPLESGIPNEAAKLAINGVLIIISAVSFGSMVDIAKMTIESMQQISSLAMPAMIALMAASGRVVSVAAIQPLMFVGVNAASHLFKSILLPLSVMAGLLFLVDSVSVRFKLKTLAKLLKSCAIWATGTVTLLFSILISVQKIASASVDAVALRTTKFAIGTLVPVAGKYMTDAAETILLCTSAASNLAGVLAVIGLGLVFAAPFIKIFIVMISFRLAAAFGSSLCDECICDALEDSAECLSVMLGIMGASLFTNILLAGTMMKLGGVIT